MSQSRSNDAVYTLVGAIFAALLFFGLSWVNDVTRPSGQSDMVRSLGCIGPDRSDPEAESEPTSTARKPAPTRKASEGDKRKRRDRVRPPTMGTIPEVTEREPAPSPEGQLLAAGARVVPLPVRGDPRRPIFSSDGRHLALEVHHHGSTQLFVSDGGANAVEVPMPAAARGSDNTDATWLPGNMLLFLSRAPGAEKQFFLYEQGAISAMGLSGTEFYPETAQAYAYDLRRERLAYVSDGVLRVRHRDGTDTRIAPAGRFADPEFAADALLFTHADRGRSGVDVVMYDFESGATEVVAGGIGAQTAPLATASHILLRDTWRGPTLTDLVSLDRRRVRRVLAENIDGTSGGPATDQRGEWVAWISARRSLDSVISVGRPDGSVTVDLATPWHQCQHPALAFDGDRLQLAFIARPARGAARQLYLVDITDQLP